MSDVMEIEEIARVIGERLTMLDKERQAVAEATRIRETSVQEEAEAERRYREMVQVVRNEGYVTDSLLGNRGHQVGKRRGRPSAAAKAASGA